MKSTPKFTNPNPSFHGEIKKRINKYFEERGIAPTGNSKLYSKAIILVVAFVSLYVHLVFFTPPHWAWIVLESIIMGCTIAAIGFNIMHDGAHGSFSNSKKVNILAAFTLNVLGGSSFMWNMKHNVIHHAYTNVDGVDDDIDIKPWMRMSSSQPKYKAHKYQHIYFWFLYSLLYIFWIFYSDYQKYFKNSIGEMPLKKMHFSDHAIFWGFKIFNLFLYIVLPIMMMGWQMWLVSFLTFSLVAGLVLSIVFQLAHTVEHTAFPVPNEVTNRLDDEWAIHQIKTTANFATDNKLVCWFVGGLNFQIEHHLFPKVSHIHYPQISKIIRQACQEYGITYIEYPKVRMAVASHVNFLREMGSK